MSNMNSILRRIDEAAEIKTREIRIAEPVSEPVSENIDISVQDYCEKDVVAVESASIRIQKEKLADLTKGLNEDEMMVVLDYIPLDLMFKKIQNELEKSRAFQKSINSAMHMYNN